MNLTIEDIRKPNNAGGFKGVRSAGAPGPNGGGKGNPRWKAIYSASRSGPRRATPEEAAQDYCDYINTQQPPQSAQLKSAGHTRTKPKKKRVLMSKRERDARQIVREETEKRLKKQGSRGFIYLIGETAPQNQPHLQSLFPYPSIVPEHVKVGWSDDEEERIKGLQTGNPRVLTVLATLPSKTKDDEKALHTKYIKHNILNEWFHPTPELLSEFGLRVAIRGTDRTYLEERTA